jgi:hypothetical protein
MSEERQPKIGEGHASAMGRQGIRELRGAMYTESNVAQQPEYGLYGTRTQGEIADARSGTERSMDEEPASDASIQSRLDQMSREGDVHGNREGDRQQERSEDMDRDH